MRALDAGILVCGECHQLNRADGDEHPRCSRCGAVLHARRPNSLTRTWALLITAAILYIPANLLPIMTVNLFGSGMPATIMEGVVELVHADMFPIAMVVFVASILVPTFKLVGIALLLYSVQRHQPMSARQRILMYRFIEWIGRWSMLDIFVIAILVALVPGHPARLWRAGNPGRAPAPTGGQLQDLRPAGLVAEPADNRDAVIRPADEKRPRALFFVLQVAFGETIHPLR